MNKFKIGTRGSLLAVTQSELLLELLHQQDSSFSGELVLIKTEGDQLTEKPLWQLDGKDFFTKELDQALLNHQVDFVIHSYKDLGSDRPKGIEIGAITKRLYPYDILLIKKETLKKIDELKNDFCVGTSSPRRTHQLTHSLSSFLPGGKFKIRCENLRGNVNTRVQKLQDGNYHAIVLAMAGLERLASHKESSKKLKSLLHDLTFMILPTTDFTPAAAQGALAVEYCATHPRAEEIASLLRKVHDDHTASEVRREKELFQSFGGGCHLAVGTHVKNLPSIKLEISKGFHHKIIDEIKLQPTPFSRSIPQNIFIGHGKTSGSNIIKDTYFKKELISFELPHDPHHLIITGMPAHRSYLEKKSGSTSSFLWAAGLATWKKLAEEGLWIHGSHEGLGDHLLKSIFDSSLIKMMTNLTSEEAIFLSHTDAQINFGKLVGVYQHMPTEISPEAKEKLRKVSHCYWSSYPQFKFYTQQIPELLRAQHFCGPGKTFERLKTENIDVTPLVQLTQFYQLIGYKDYHEL